MTSRATLAKMIEGILLAPTATRQQVSAFCERALDFHLAAVCVFPYWARASAEVLNGSDVKVCVPIGLPFGTCPTAVKLLEAKTAIGAGANEIDVVINVGALKSHDLSTVAKDLEEITRMAKLAGMTENREDVLLHAVLETSYLTKDELDSACRIALANGIEFVKTSSGLVPCNPNPKEIRLLRQRVGNDVGIKVAASVQTAPEVVKLINIGATRVGATRGCQIVEAVPPDPDET